MKHTRRIFSIVMVICVIFLEMAQALPAYAFDTVEINSDSLKKVDAQLTKETVKENAVTPTDWSKVNWDEEVVLLSDLDEYRDELDKLLEAGDLVVAKNLKPKKHKMSSDEALDNFAVPLDVKQVVSEYREKSSVFAGTKIKDVKLLLQDRIKSVLPLGVVTFDDRNLLIEGDNSVDIREAKKVNVNNLIPVESITNQELEIKILRAKELSLKFVQIRACDPNTGNRTDADSLYFYSHWTDAEFEKELDLAIDRLNNSAYLKILKYHKLIS